MARSYQRRQYFIDKGFQAKFIAKFCSIVVISSLLIGGIMFWFLRDSNTVAIENTHVIVKNTADFILPIAAITLLIVAVFSGLAVAVISLVTSHKISGPLYRLEKEIDALQAADFRRNFKIRGDDQLQVLAKGLDEMCNTLREKHLELKDEYKTLKEYLDNSNWQVSNDNSQQLRAVVIKLGEIISSFKA